MKNLYEISFDENGIKRRENLYRIFWLWSHLRGNSGFHSERIAWSEIESAYVYKRDAYTIDVICLAFRLKNDKRFRAERINGGLGKSHRKSSQTFAGLLRISRMVYDGRFSRF